MVGDGGPWWSADHEKNFYEAVVVVFLVLLAMLFEDVFHKLAHSSEHSYAYGASKDAHQNEEDRAHQHKQLFKELAQRLGSEFMTLGFLAFVIFLCNISGFFKFLTDLGNSTYGESEPAADEGHRLLAAAAAADPGLLIGPAHMPMPRDAADLLHLTEEVHIRMFFGMVIYFGLVLSIIHAGVTRVKEWAELTNRRILLELNKLHDFHDSALTEYKELTKYTVVHIVNWHQTDEERWEKLVRSLYDEADYMPSDDCDELREDVKERLKQQFSLSHYLASSLEDGLLDIIEVHRVTWASLMVLFIFFMFLHQQEVTMVYIAGAILFVGVLGIGLTHYQVRGQDRNIEFAAHACSRRDVTSSTIPSTSTPQCKPTRRGCMFSQFFFLRAFETVIFIWCYSFASIIFNTEGWEHDFLVSLVETLLYAIFTFVAGSFLPTAVTHLLIHLSLPPHLDDVHMKILLRTIRDDDPALLDLARTGDAEIQQAVSQANVHHVSGRGPFRVPSSWSNGTSPPCTPKNRTPRNRDRADSGESGLGMEDSLATGSAPRRAPSGSPRPPAVTVAPPRALPADRTLTARLSAMLATPAGYELVQGMMEEATRLRCAGGEQLAQAQAAADVQALRPVSFAAPAKEAPAHDDTFAV